MTVKLLSLGYSSRTTPEVYRRRFGDGFVGVPFLRAHYALN